MRLAYILPVVLFLGLAVAFAAFMMLGRDTRVLPSVLINQPVPAFDLPPLRTGEDGIATSDLLGGKGVKMVNFFASWCGPCRVEHPVLMRIAEKGEMPIYGIDYKDQPADALDWLRRLGDPFARIAADRDGRTAIDWGVYGIPETFVIDGAGKIRYRHAGAMTPEVLNGTIRPLIEEIAR